jgi:hypothetical protein
MNPKNRKFNVAGIGHYSDDYEEGELVYFELEPSNKFDSNAIKVLNSKLDQIGYVPRDKAAEFNELIDGKYPHYCAKILEIWDGNDGDAMPKVIAHFSNHPSELPFPEQEWINSGKNEAKHPIQLKVKLPVALNWVLLIIGVALLFGIWKVLQELVDNYFISAAVVLVIGYLFLHVFSYFLTEEMTDEIEKIKK